MSKPIGTYELFKKDSKARLGRFHTAHGAFDTPNFMPVGTQGTVKGLAPDRLKDAGAQIILSNTYHLHLRPGDELIRDLGGLHKFMSWDRPILTDSGGFQVFSLSGLRKVTDDGVVFRSHIDGAPVEFTPEKVVKIQENLGVDIMMVLDECPPHTATREEIISSLDRTHSWARRAKEARADENVLAFGIVQGGMFDDLREQSVEKISEIGFDGYAIGGVSVGEPVEYMRRITSLCAPLLPEDTIRYVMGVGTPSDIVYAVSQGIDLFDCVIPTRSARFGRIYVGNGHINIRNSKYRTDPRPLQEGCDCYTCQNFSRAYISHLVHSQEALAIELASLHNVRFYERLMEDIRSAIGQGKFQEFQQRFLEDNNE